MLQGFKTIYHKMAGQMVGLSSLLIGFVGIIATLVLTHAAFIANETERQTAFDRKNSEIITKMSSHLDAYENALLHARGLFYASAEVDRSEFRTFTETMQIKEKYPGILGVGYTQVISPKDLKSHEKMIRDQGFSDYRVWPEGERDIYTSIIFLEPFDWRNQRAFGYDMFSEPIRHEAMSRARDSGQPAVSRKITLVQETDIDRQNGMLMYVPVYDKNIPLKDLDTVEKRRAALVGYVYAPFRTRDLFDAIVKSINSEEKDLVDVEIFEAGIDPAPEPKIGDVLIYDSHPESAGTKEGLRVFQRETSQNWRFSTITKNTEIQEGGIKFLIHIKSLPKFNEANPISPPFFVLAGGIFMTILLVLLAQAYENYNSGIRLSETRLQTITDTLPVLISHLDAEGRFIFTNAAHLDWFGYGPQELRRLSIEDVYGPMDHLPAKVFIKRVLENESMSFESVLKHRALGERQVRVEVRPIRYQRQKITEMVVLVTDLQDQKDLASRLERDKLALERSEDLYRQIAQENERLYKEAQLVNRSKDEFLATLSHELRTPLNVIQGHAELLAAKSDSFPGYEDSIDAIYRNAKSQAQLVEDLLEVSSIITGKMIIKAQPLDIGTVIAKSVDSVKLVAQGKDIRLETSIEPSPRKVSGDQTRLQQITWNLLSNAIKFTPKGGVITVVGEALNDRYRISVKDTGQGMDPEFLPHVFERFRQEDNSSTRRFGGLGLGLSIARNLVELHKGRIWAKSEGRDKGSEFIFEIPYSEQITQTSPQMRTHSVSVHEEKNETPSFEKIKGALVLIVDDEPDSRKLLERYLEKIPVKILAAASAKEATEICKKNHPDLIISDISMPDEDGYAMLRRFRHQEGIQIPAIALTAYAREEDRQRAASAGYQMHLSKPVSSADLIGAVRTLLLSGTFSAKHDHLKTETHSI